jgi:hypothetical protein
MTSDSQSRDRALLVREVAHTHIRDALKMRRSQLAPKGPTLFDFHICRVELDDEETRSTGERWVTGPLPIRTDTEKDLVALNHLYAPTDFRARLDCEDTRVIIAVRIIEINGSTHHFIIETAGSD